jgi:hypothetical protein
MDKNTLTGLVLVGVVFSVFTIFMQPSKEELQAQEKAKKEQASRTDKKIQKKSVTARSIASPTNKDEVRPVGETVKGELVRLENDKLIILIDKLLQDIDDYDKSQIKNNNYEGIMKGL